jgi:hypothetical protein
MRDLQEVRPQRSSAGNQLAFGRLLDVSRQQ